MDPGLSGDAPCGCESDAEPIACTLSVDQLERRLDEWGALRAQATGRADLPDGVALQFPRSVDVAAIAALLAAEQECCRFFTFRVTITTTEVTVEITAPREARHLVEDLAGTGLVS